MGLRKWGDRVVVSGKCEEFVKGWCVVEYQFDSIPMWIGAVGLQHVYTFSQMTGNSEWRKLYHPERMITIYIRAIGDKLSCMQEATKTLREMPTMPHCNLRGVNSYAISIPLICSNGETYQSQAEAARILGLNQSALSKHLRGELMQVKGYTFARKNG